MLPISFFRSLPTTQDHKGEGWNEVKAVNWEICLTALHHNRPVQHLHLSTSQSLSKTWRYSHSITWGRNSWHTFLLTGILYLDYSATGLYIHQVSEWGNKWGIISNTSTLAKVKSTANNKCKCWHCCLPLPMSHTVQSAALELDLSIITQPYFFRGLLTTQNVVEDGVWKLVRVQYHL